MMVSGIPQQEVRPPLTCTVLLARNLLCAGLPFGSGEGFSPLGETGPPKGEEAALPTTLSGLGSVDGSCPRSLLDLRGWGVLWGRGFEEAILVQTTVVEC